MVRGRQGGARHCGTSAAARTRFAALNGEHPLREAVPDGYVDYAVATRHGGRVLYFNFELAREMGLIRPGHPDHLSQTLSHAILHAFAVEIINEYDLLHRRTPAAEDIRPRKYMATRYLQLQHPSRRGYTSGDGRSVWNGIVRGRGVTWDVSSCGTGATCLSPATAINRRFYQTGDRHVSYGCGRADLWDGLAAALMSEIMYYNNFRTERTLAIIDYGDGTSVNVRAYPNLLRPAHFFYHLKQGNLPGLRRAVDYYIDRQIANGEWPRLRTAAQRYRYLLRRVTEDFARVAAQFEAEYVFCWMDWDGDNILIDGGIIDYGSLRQFGLYHHEYRYDDVNRMSTTIAEQKRKARYIVQTFAQLTEFLLKGRKRNIKLFRRHTALGEFDRIFRAAKDDMVLYKMGFAPRLQRRLRADRVAMREVGRLRRLLEYFEKAKATRGRYQVADGITWDAIFCVRDILRELPLAYLAGDALLASPRMLEILRSKYATPEDLALYPGRVRRLAELQRSYLTLVARAGHLARLSRAHVLAGLAERSGVINRYERVTGDAIIHVAKEIFDHAEQMTFGELYDACRSFIASQVLVPERRTGETESPKNKVVYDISRRICRSASQIVASCRDGI